MNKNMRNMSMIMSVLLMIISTTVVNVNVASAETSPNTNPTGIAMDQYSKDWLDGITVAGIHYQFVTISNNKFIPETIYTESNIIVFIFNEDSISHFVKFSDQNEEYYEILSGRIYGLCCKVKNIGDVIEYQDRDFLDMKGRTIVIANPASVQARIPTGYISVLTTPVSGNIFVDGVFKGTERWTGTTESIGNHVVSFGPVSGYTIPSSRNIVVNAGQSTNVMGTYVPIQTSIPQLEIHLPYPRYVNQPLNIAIVNKGTGHAVIDANTRICLTNTNNCLVLNTDANGNVAFRPLNKDYQIWATASGYQSAALRFDVTNSVSTPAVTYTARPEPTYIAKPVVTYVPKPGTLEDPNPGCWSSAFGFGMCTGSIAAKTGVGLVMGIGKGIVQLFGGE